MHSGKLTIAWFEHAKPKPAYYEESGHDNLLKAVVRIITQSHQPGFLLGQVMTADCKVLANVAPAGAIMMMTSD